MAAEAFAVPTMVAGMRRAGAITLCTHCGLRVPPGLVDASQSQQFCCHGCQTAYTVIHACGLDRYYQLLAQTHEARPASTTSKRYGEYDDDAFHSLYVRPWNGAATNASVGGALLTTELFVDNVHCAACLWLLEKLPRVVPGVIEARVDLRRRAVRVVWDPALVQLSRAAAALDSLGYPPHPVRQASTLASRRTEDRRYLVRLGIAGACAGNVMLLAFALYAGLFDGLEPIFARIFSYLSFGFTLVSLAWPGRVFFTSAIAAIRTRTLHLDLPIALGLSAGAVWSAYITIFAPMGWEAGRIVGTGGIYFDSLAMLVFALLIGRFIQHRQQRWATDSVELLFSLSPASARLVEGDSVRETPTDSIRAGQLVEVLAGECVPVDGVIETGSSQVDQAILTGESVAVEVALGSRVAAGSTNLSGTIRVRVEATGGDTRVGKLMQLVEECSRRRAPIVLMANKLAGWFVASMTILAIATGAYWWFQPNGGPSRAFEYAISLLIVVCPCGLGLATPLAMTIALGRAGRRGLLIKGGDAVQTLGTSGVMFIDKTGTITEGRLALIEWHGDASLKRLVGEVERQSTHPVALALAVLADDAAAPRRVCVQSTIGGGVAGSVGGDDGSSERTVVAGTRQFLRQRGIEVRADLEVLAGRAAARGLTPVFVAGGDGEQALALLGDPIRPDAAASITRLQNLGWQVRVLSGDHPETVAAVGRALGLPTDAVRGGVTPEEKAQIVEAMRITTSGGTSRPVMMVGDGVNDAAALAAASVGVAVHGGAEASLAAADVAVTRPGLAPVVELVTGARRTMHALGVNFVVSIIYNIAAAALCVTGIVTPLIAAVLMLTSSLTVLALSFRVWGRASEE